MSNRKQSTPQLRAKVVDELRDAVAHGVYPSKTAAAEALAKKYHRIPATIISWEQNMPRPEDDTTESVDDPAPGAEVEIAELVLPENDPTADELWRTTAIQAAEIAGLREQLQAAEKLATAETTRADDAESRLRKLKNHVLASAQADLAELSQAI